MKEKTKFNTEEFINMNIKDIASIIKESIENNCVSSIHMTTYTSTTRNNISIYNFEFADCSIIKHLNYEILRIHLSANSIDIILKNEYYNTNIEKRENHTKYEISSKETTTTGNSYFTLLLYIKNENINIKSTI